MNLYGFIRSVDVCVSGEVAHTAVHFCMFKAGKNEILSKSHRYLKIWL